MDKLDDIFRRQDAFDSDLAVRRGLDYSDRALWVQREMMALMVEASEVLSEANFKWWKNPKPLDNQRLLDEFADMLHFFVAACLKMGFTSDDIHQAYVAKNEENFRRQKGLSDKPGYESPPK